MNKKETLSLSVPSVVKVKIRLVDSRLALVRSIFAMNALIFIVSISQRWLEVQLQWRSLPIYVPHVGPILPQAIAIATIVALNLHR